MKKLLFIFAAAMLLVSCSTEYDTQSNATKEVTFNVCGDFSLKSVTNLTRSSDANAYELWIFDYCGGELQQVIHQKLGDNSPKMTLICDRHQLFFVISNGVNPVVNNGERTIRWERPGDTFQATEILEVEEGTQGLIPINMKRVAAKLTVKVENDFPANASAFKITIPRWFYSVDYSTGRAVHDKAMQYTETIPEGNELSYYTLTEGNYYYTTAYIEVVNLNNEQIAAARINAVTMERGKNSTYSGTFVYNDNDSRSATFAFHLSEWEQGVQGTWY